MNKIEFLFCKIAFLFTISLSACADKTATTTPSNRDQIVDLNKQDSIFTHLLNVTNYGIPDDVLKDSLAFLILPVEASCPSCREKTIDSIVKHKSSLADRRFIIISANGGYKTINSYFHERNSTLPEIKTNIFLDSTNQSHKFDLYDEQPTIYYTYNKKALVKIISKPSNIRENLHRFFSDNQ